MLNSIGASTVICGSPFLCRCQPDKHFTSGPHVATSGYKWQRNSSGTPLECMPARHGLLIKIMPLVCHTWPYGTTSAVKFVWATCGPHSPTKRKLLVMLPCGRLFDLACCV